MKLSSPLFLFRCTVIVAVLAAAAWAPTPARSQTVARPSLPAAAPHDNPSGAEDRRFSSAYGRYARLADRGDPSAAAAALFMFRHGKSMFGSDWAATEGQQARWNALAVNAARYQLALPNGADD